MRAMELSEAEQRVYGELFDRLEDKASGGKRITGVRAGELFLASGLPPENLLQITELCGAKRLGHFGRSQFYIALKLIAAAQAGLPVSLDTIAPGSGNEIPLPKFSKTPEVIHYQGATSTAAEGGFHAPLSTTGALPPPPTKGHMRSLSNQRMSSHMTSTAADASGTQVATGVIPTQPHLAQSSLANANQGFRVGGPASFSPSKHAVPPISPSAAANFRPAIMQGPVAKVAAPQSVVGHAGHLTHTTPLVSSGVPVPTAPLSPQEGSSAVGGQQSTSTASQIVTDNNTNSAKGWVPFDEDVSIVVGVDAAPDARLGAATGDGEERSSSFDTTSLSSASDTEDVWTISEEQREYYTAQFKSMQSDVDGLIHGSVAKVFFEKSRLPIHELSKIWQLSDVTRDGALNLEEFCTCMHLVVLRRNDIEIPDTLPVSLVPFAPIHQDDARLIDFSIAQHPDLDQQQQAFLPSGAAGAAPAVVPAHPGSGAGLHYQPSQAAATQPQPTQQQQQQWAHFSESPTSSVLSSPGSKPLNFDFQKPHVDDSKIAHPVALKVNHSNATAPISQQQQQPHHSQHPMTTMSPEPPPPPPRPRLHSRENSLDINKQFSMPPSQPPVSPKNPPAPDTNSLPIGLNALSTTGNSVAGQARETDGVIRLDDGTELPRPQHLGPISREGHAQLQDLTSKIRKLKDVRQQLIVTNNEMNQELQEVMEQRIGLEIQFEHLMHRNDVL